MNISEKEEIIHQTQIINKPLRKIFRQLQIYQIYPASISKIQLNCQKHHYNMYVIKRNSMKYHCSLYFLNCLHYFRTENKLKFYEKVCKKIFFCGIITPSKKDNTLEFN